MKAKWILVGMILLMASSSAQAWSSRASVTQTDIWRFSNAIEAYRSEDGTLPSSEGIWTDFGRMGQLKNGKMPPTDQWGRPLVYRAPGKHGEYDLYSFGADGIDDDGKRDDISNWAGVNDGYHWMATWPRGRLSIVLGIMLGLGGLLLARINSWTLVAPLFGAVGCLGVALGCHWLLHPGEVPGRNGLLAIYRDIAVGILVILVIKFIVDIRNQNRPSR
jgi:general secretion pathway protein G